MNISTYLRFHARFHYIPHEISAITGFDDCTVGFYIDNNCNSVVCSIDICLSDARWLNDTCWYSNKYNIFNTVYQ